MKIKDTQEMLNDSYGFILSYGDTTSLTPLGLYKFASYDKENETIILSNSNNENDVIKMPSSSFKMLLSSKLNENNFMLKQLSNLSEVQDESIKVGMDLAESFLIDSAKFDLSFNDKLSLDELQATYETDGTLRATNYSMIPFSYGKVKVKKMRFTDHSASSDVKTR